MVPEPPKVGHGQWKKRRCCTCFYVLYVHVFWQRRPFHGAEHCRNEEGNYYLFYCVFALLLYVYKCFSLMKFCENWQITLNIRFHLLITPKQTGDMILWNIFCLIWEIISQKLLLSNIHKVAGLHHATRAPSARKFLNVSYVNKKMAVCLILLFSLV